ncbi:hypothetical protein [Salinicoccus sp. CNSTN-B1]
MAERTQVEDIFKIRAVTAPKIGTFGITALVTRLDEEKNDYFTHLYKMDEDGKGNLHITKSGCRTSGIQQMAGGSCSSPRRMIKTRSSYLRHLAERGCS